MTLEKITTTLLNTTGIGLLSGFIGGVALYFAIILKAQAQAEGLDAMSRASDMCAAGSAAFALAILSIPAGAIFGFGLGGFFLWRETAAQRRPLP